MQTKKLPWELYPHIWKTEAAFMAYIRGGIRRSLWNRHPVKLEFIKNNRIKIPNPNPKGRVSEVWGGICALTGAVLPLKDLEVDHKQGNHSLQSMSDVGSFVSAIVLIAEDDLQFVSKEAHKVKSYAEKMGISFEEALLEKEVISFRKLKVDEQKKKLLTLGLSPATMATVAKRVEAYRQYLKENNNA